MVMCLILKAYQPLFGIRIYAVSGLYLNRYNYGAGVDLVGLFHIGKYTVVAQLLHCDKRKVHKADELVIPVLIELFPCIQIA